MPPNNPLSYENLQALDLSKHRHVSGFLPLTHPDEERLHQESLAQDKDGKNGSSVSSVSPFKAFHAVLDVEHQQEEEEEETLGLVVEEIESTPITSPPKRYNEQVERILAADEARAILSCDAMIQNLVHDSVTRRFEHQVPVPPVTDEECYWDMPATTSTSCITQEEACGVVQAALEIDTSSSSSSTPEQVITASHVHDATHPNHSYWDELPQEPSTTTTTLERSSQKTQAELLQSILQSEAIRSLLSVQHVSQVEELNSKPLLQLSDGAMQQQVQHEFYSANVSDEYWDTSSYSTTTADHVKDASHPHHSYWDEPARVTTQEGAKQALIQQILKEEQLRNLVSTEFMIQTELDSFSSSSTTTMESQDPASKEYWIQPCQISSEEKRLDTIVQIVQQEEKRQLLSTCNIVNQLVHDSQMNVVGSGGATTTAAACVGNGDSSPSYWDW